MGTKVAQENGSIQFLIAGMQRKLDDLVEKNEDEKFQETPGKYNLKASRGPSSALKLTQNGD